ncbi:MAG TPA: dTDP-4-dehydrorhamnose 3,5-epimerase [Opitutales bacterium]|nr:dTDP-4-dehydrorhamnose 3,5-epimerase [Opitutales bacterium]
MKFTPTSIKNAFVIEWESSSDDRGSFARIFCAREFKDQGLHPKIVQANLCTTKEKGTLRGMHFQIPPAEESKLVRCVRGSIFDVIVDMRADSPTFLKHFGILLSSENRRALYVPPLCAHGYQTLTDDAHVLYQTGEFYNPECERGLRYNDPALKLEWPLPISSISEKDANWPLLGKPIEYEHSHSTSDLA